MWCQSYFKTIENELKQLWLSDGKTTLVSLVCVCWISKVQVHFLTIYGFQITTASCLNLATENKHETKWLFPKTSTLYKNTYVLGYWKYKVIVYSLFNTHEILHMSWLKRLQRTPKNVPFRLSRSHVRYNFEIATIVSMSCVKISC